MEFQDVHTAVFVFVKDKKIKVLNLRQCEEEKEYLSSTGWIHTLTLNPCLFIQSLANDLNKKEIQELLESLRNPENDQKSTNSTITPSIKEQLKSK